jgi:predicted MPP superfamily phosphohydrolase
VRPPQLARIGRALARLRPELVLFLGDFVDDEVALGEEVTPERAAGALDPSPAPLGVFGVLGNHDWRYDGPRVSAAMERAGVRILENEAVRIDRGGTPLWLVAVGDMASGRADVDRALAGVPEGEPVLLATHSPDVFPQVPARVALTLAGHTHGAQVNIPLLRRRWTPSRFGARYADPVVEEDGRLLFAHPGIGTSTVPVRLGATPEVTLLVLRARRGRRPGG